MSFISLLSCLSEPKNLETFLYLMNAVLFQSHQSQGCIQFANSVGLIGWLAFSCEVTEGNNETTCTANSDKASHGPREILRVGCKLPKHGSTG